MFKLTSTKKTGLFAVIIFMLTVCRVESLSAQQGQRGQDSELLITYDFINPESKTEIPFDKYFTLRILHFNTDNIHKIKVYEAQFEKGKRTLKTDYMVNTMKMSTFDFEIQKKDYKVKHDTLLLYFPPIKPDKEFEIAVIRGLTAKNLETAFKLNEDIVNGGTNAQTIYNDLKTGVKDASFGISVIKAQTLADYQTEFNNNFVTYYNHLKQPANFPSVPFLTTFDLNLMHKGYLQQNIQFKWGHVPVRLIKESKLDDMFAGYLPADYDSNTKKASPENYKTRVENLARSISIMDTIYRNLNTFLFKDDDPRFEPIRAILEKTISRLKANKKFINDEITALTAEMQLNTQLEEVEMVVGGTRAKDIKTQGMNIFTLDLGVVALGSWNSRNQFAVLPKLYYGVNIYFRPINKNTRQENLPDGLVADPLKGPDYNIAAQKSIWQHLHLTVGLAPGGYRSSEFEPLFNNTTLLVGGGYRMYRAFKVTAGAAFLRRASNNPVITEKGLFVGPFMSFSADIDLVQTIKDVINPLWK
jgi:hypothetical protein